MATIEFVDVRKSFAGGRAVLGGVSLSVADGEFFTFLGPSGCGKTTLLRIAAGLESPDAGGVRIDGRDVTETAPRERDVAMVFQSYALYPHMTVAENVSIGLTLRGVAAEEAASRAKDVASMLGIAEMMDRLPATLSGGQRQRVALARAVVRRPKVFLLDEPLSNLDASLRDRTRAELRLLFRRVGGTVLYVTHDQVEAMTMSDRVAVLHEGALLQVGSPQEVYDRPRTTFVAEFVGAHRMNLSPIGPGAPPAPPGAATWGIRPEHVRLPAGEGDATIDGEVLLAESHGAEVLFHVTTAAGTIRAASRTGAASAGARVTLGFPRAAVHWFDAGGRRLDTP
ncbi:MAG: ABC transporter ATP-binding protein [Planctomycetota bacterium]